VQAAVVEPRIPCLQAWGVSRRDRSGALICPECHDEMRTAFVSDPKKFKEWEREPLAQP